MILVLSRLQPLSGNKLLVALAILLLASCSPKIKPLPAPNLPKEEVKDVETKVDINKDGPAKIALVLPFKADLSNLNSSADLESSSMAIDFYQGFVMGVDSASSSGRNFNLQVIDSESKKNSAVGLSNIGQITAADLLVGPVFPDNIKKANLGKQYIVSPLAAADPAEFSNNRLISLNPSLRLHAQRIATHIKNTYVLNNQVILLHNAKSDVVFGDELSSKLNSAGEKYVFQSFQGISDFEKKVQKGVKYAVILTSLDKNVVLQTMDKLIALKKRYGISVNLYGHPNWAKQNYAIEKLQELNTTITSAYHVNFKTPAVIQFVKAYRNKYAIEPTEFSFKGYDAGLYFSKLLAQKGRKFVNYLTDTQYKGLQNGFSFVYDEDLGYMNQEVWLLRYRNFQMIPIN